MRKENPFGFYSFVFVFLIALFCMGNIIERHQSLGLVVAYISAFVSYLFLYQEKDSWKFLLGVGILSRVVLFPSMPPLSDDIYRFIWDGTLSLNGIHPFNELPGYYLDKSVQGLTPELYQKLNSPNYYTVYPPINQGIFWLSAWIGGENWLGAAGVIRLLLLGAEIGSFVFLTRLLTFYGKDKNLAFLYFLNPLIILEFVGNVHFEGFVIFFFLMGLYAFEKARKLPAIAGFGLAIGIKLLPLIYLPFLFIKGIPSKKWLIPVGAGAVALLTLVPMLTTSFLNGMQNSLDLYFRTFEFNASFYFIAREIGFWIYGYNNIDQIGPLLSVLSLISILTISFIAFKKNWSVPKTTLFILFIYLLFTTTVHPWYTLPLVAFGVLSGYYFPIVWSLAIFITYLGYSTTGYNLPLHWVLLEYMIVIIALFLDLKKSKWIA